MTDKELKKYHKKQVAEYNEYKKKLDKLTKDKILLVEDGSVDMDKLEEDGWYMIVYRRGATPPMLLDTKRRGKW